MPIPVTATRLIPAHGVQQVARPPATTGVSSKHVVPQAGHRYSRPRRQGWKRSGIERQLDLELVFNENQQLSHPERINSKFLQRFIEREARGSTCNSH